MVCYVFRSKSNSEFLSKMLRVAMLEGDDVAGSKTSRQHLLYLKCGKNLTYGPCGPNVTAEKPMARRPAPMGSINDANEGRGHGDKY